MDRLSFVFSLLLIVSVTTITFGYVIKAKNSNGESLEEPQSDPDLFPNTALKERGAFLKRSHHQSNPETDAQAKLQLLKDVKIKRGLKKITLEILNLSGNDLIDPSIFFKKGSSTHSPPPTVPDGVKLSFDVGNSFGSVAGVLVYYIEEEDESLAILFSVSQYENRWNLQGYHGHPTANAQQYSEMITTAKIANSEFQDGHVGSLSYRVKMTTSPLASLEIQLTPR